MIRNRKFRESKSSTLSKINLHSYKLIVSKKDHSHQRKVPIWILSLFFLHSQSLFHHPFFEAPRYLPSCNHIIRRAVNCKRYPARRRSRSWSYKFPRPWTRSSAPLFSRAKRRGGLGAAPDPLSSPLGNSRWT